MRTIHLIVLSLLVVQLGCNRLPNVMNPPIYRPENFRTDIESLIANKQYSAPIAYLKSADPKRQADYDKQGYLAVGQDTLVLPGITAPELYYPPRDWLFPGTQDAIQDWAWQEASTDFAEQYNLIRNRK